MLGETTGLHNLYFHDRNLSFHGEKFKLTFPSTFVFLVTKSAGSDKGKQRLFFYLRKYPFLMVSRRFYSLIPPAIQQCMPHNSMPGETGKGNNISSEPLMVDKEKGTWSSPVLFESSQRCAAPIKQGRVCWEIQSSKGACLASFHPPRVRGLYEILW